MNDLNFELIPTKKADAQSFKINGITVHSVYDPVSEARKWAAQVIDRVASEGSITSISILFSSFFNKSAKASI